jgi:DNA-nicking Smr family endonuclease
LLNRILKAGPARNAAHYTGIDANAGSERHDMRSTSDDDLRAFREAMSDVRPLPPREPPPAAPAPRPSARFARADEQQVLRESLLPPEDPSALETGEELVFRRPWIRADVLKRLRRGHYAVASELDLHGLGRHAAHAALREFIGEASGRGHGCVRVIHGKGRGSGARGPVLKQVVNHWLRRMDEVVAFASARPADGGTGAVYVLLAGGAGRAPRLRPVSR